jgi:hypothetical protein
MCRACWSVLIVRGEGPAEKEGISVGLREFDAIALVQNAEGVA